MATVPPLSLLLPAPLLLLLLLPCLALLAPAAAAAGTPVLDTDGQPLLRGMPYYVLAPQVRGDANLGLSPLGSCPLGVYLKPFPYGPAALFFPERSGGGSPVLEGEDLSVMFAAPTKCPDSTQWRVDGRTGLVTTGGALAPATAKVSDSRFRMARYALRPDRNFYLLSSCPGGGAPCRTLGVTTEQLLRVTTEQLVVSFTKVK